MNATTAAARVMLLTNTYKLVYVRDAMGVPRLVRERVYYVARPKAAQGTAAR